MSRNLGSLYLKTSNLGNHQQKQNTLFTCRNMSAMIDNELNNKLNKNHVKLQEITSSRKTNIDLKRRHGLMMFKRIAADLRDF